MSPPLLSTPRLAAATMLLACGWTTIANADPPSNRTRAVLQPPEHAAVEESAWWCEGVGRLGTLWDDARHRLRDSGPDWLHRQTRRNHASTLTSRDDRGPTSVVLQEDRADGTDLVTLRYATRRQGALRAYAGAGLNHAQYYVDEDTAGPSLLTRRNRHAAIGPAAELGADLALTERVRLNADVRWADLDQRADLLRGSYGPVAADSVTVGVSVGYRFR